ncbi:hypothetical protein INR49_020463 [Caranx melampygus]|nr:hypothetical protein INR49_020463 [Caranx melampygus]
MYSQYWDTARGLRPDHRRYTVVEGDSPLPLGSTCRRKRLRSAREEDGEEARRSCVSRPNPEGSQSASELSRYGKPEEEEELQRLCQRCHIMASQLKRQAAALADPLALKDPAYASFLFQKLQRLQWPRPSHHASVDARCDVCNASFQQLRRLALRRALGISIDMAPCPAAPPAPLTPPLRLLKAAGWAMSFRQSSRGGRTMGSTRGAGLCGVGASVASEGNCATIGAKPAAHSIATQTIQPPSAAAAFFIRSVNATLNSHMKTTVELKMKTSSIQSH